MTEPIQPGASNSATADSGPYRGVDIALSPQDLGVTPDGGDAYALTGEVVDRAEHDMPLSAKFAFPISLGLASGEEATFAVAIQDAPTASPNDPTNNAPGSFANYGEQPATITLRGNDDDSVLETAVSINVDLSGARRFVKANATLTVPASGVSAKVAGVAVLGGMESLPRA